MPPESSSPNQLLLTRPPCCQIRTWKLPLHDCQEIIAEITQVRPNLQDSALPNSELVRYTDGSSFVSDGVRKAGAAVVDQGGNII
jgi:hypothetical protein